MTVKEVLDVFGRNWDTFKNIHRAGERTLELASIVSRKSERDPDFFKEETDILKFCTRFCTTPIYAANLELGWGWRPSQFGEDLEGERRDVIPTPDNNQAAVRDLPSTLHPFARDLLESPQPLTFELVRERYPQVSRATVYNIRNRVAKQIKEVLV